jgi:hypothetical protein
MKNLKLSEIDKKGLKLGWSSGDQMGLIDPKAMGKLLSENPAFADGTANTLGRIWCTLGGIACKTVVGNVFMFTFHQASGKRKAI